MHGLLLMNDLGVAKTGVNPAVCWPLCQLSCRRTVDSSISLTSYSDLPRPGESSRKSTVANQIPTSANHKTAENDATLTLLLYWRALNAYWCLRSYSAYCYCTFLHLASEKHLRSSNAGGTINRMKLRAQNFSREREAQAGQWDRKWDGRTLTNGLSELAKKLFI